MKFSICINSVFRGTDSVEAVKKVKEAGFDAFEFWGWKNLDLDAMSAAAKENGVSCICFCTSSFNLTDPGQRNAFTEGIRESTAAAKKMGAPFLITQSGNDTGAVRSFQRRSVIAGLKAAAPLLEDSGVTLLLEPLNGKIDHQGIFLESSDEGFEITRETGSPNIKLLFDIYHQQITEGDIIRRITANVGCIGHIHCAGNPGRNELYSGELDYCRIFRAAESAGYSGFFGLEYFPLEPAAEGLRKIREMIK